MQPDTTQLVPDHMRSALVQATGDVIAHIEWAQRRNDTSLYEVRRAIRCAQNAIQAIKDQVDKGICAAEYQDEVDRILNEIAANETL